MVSARAIFADAPPRDPSSSRTARPLGVRRRVAVVGILLRGARMTTHITEDCINCGACEAECPNKAIAQGADIYEIDAERCTECVGFHEKEACQAVCPVECCLPDPNAVEAEAVLLARALALHPDDAQLHAGAKAGTFPSRFRA